MFQTVQNIALPANDTHFKSHLLADNGRYQYKKIKLAMDLITSRNNIIALDIGAHVGLWAKELAKHFSSVIAFEPCSINRECLLKNTENLRNTRVCPYALGEITGTVNLVQTKDNSGNTYIKPNGLKGTVTVDMYRLDDTSISNYLINFIKIDVEGFELSVIKGAEKTIKKNKPVIVIEQKPNNAERYGYNRYDALNLLKSWGMYVVWSKAGDYCLSWK